MFVGITTRRALKQLVCVEILFFVINENLLHKLQDNLKPNLKEEMYVLSSLKTLQNIYLFANHFCSVKWLSR